MDLSEKVWKRLCEKRLIALLAPAKAEDCVAAFEALDPLGVVLEIALRTDAAIQGIKAVRAAHPGALVLAGTVMTGDQAQRALDVGAAGLVSPDYLPDVLEEALSRGALCVPGGLGDVGKQLAHKARRLDVRFEDLPARHPEQWVHKLFPAMAAGGVPLELVKAWKSVWKGLRIVYTGGVSLDNVGEIARLDPEGIFCGSALTKSIDDPEQMVAEARTWLAAIHGEPSSAPAQKAPPTPPAPGTPQVVTFGEIMLRLATPDGLRFRQATGFEATYGGAEANVAVALACGGIPSRFVTALPAHAVGQAAVDRLASFGVDTSCILRRGARVGAYFLEPGASQRPSKVIYDRAGSAISELGPGQVDWDAALEGASWFHFTGITPALSRATAEATLEACRAAKRVGATISVDLNYRAKLWSEEQARRTMTPLMKYVDVVVANEEDAAKVFGITAENTDVDAGELDARSYEAVAAQLVERFGLRLAAITLRESLSASDNSWSACLWDGETFHRSRTYPIHIVDRVGGGDAFAAGLIGGLLADKTPAEALEYAVAASCLAHTIRGDFNLVDRAEVEALLAGGGSGRIQR